MKMGDSLITKHVNFFPMENAEKHHTEKYDLLKSSNGEAQTSIVRRGQPFTGEATFNRPYNPEEDIVQFVFTLGSAVHKNTRGLVYMKKDATPKKDSWSATFLKSDQNNVYFEVSSPVDTPVGAWKLQVITKKKVDDDSSTTIWDAYIFEHDLYILFNPWNKDDQTYMPRTELLKEYVLNDKGFIMVMNSHKPKSWDFGQFHQKVLPMIMFILDKLEVPYQDRGDVIKMSRFITAVLNSEDDRGVLEGSWDGQYSDGKSPDSWTGSVDILSRFYDNKEPVKYGQCWVFAGVVNTVCRALGIPSRAVSNYYSANDGDDSLSVDIYLEKDLKKIEKDPKNPDVGTDSTWNFHVWNDVWMSRPDLPPGYGGWQAIDATPQVSSDGKKQCGPASLEAIKHGQVCFKYDVKYLLAAVNGDLRWWIRDPKAESGYSLLETDKQKVGAYIMTFPYKVLLGDGAYEDILYITKQYKFDEHSISERIALMQGIVHSERSKRYNLLSNSDKLQPDIVFKLRDIEKVLIGQDFQVIVNIENTSSQDRNVNAYLSATSIYNNGAKYDLVQSSEKKVLVGPKKVETISLLITADTYLPKLAESYKMKILAMVFVEETNQAWTDENYFQIFKPNIKIVFNEELRVGQAAIANLSFLNPFNYPLTKCKVQLTSSGIKDETLRADLNDVQAGEQLNNQLSFYPNKSGIFKFDATFTSTELKDVNGSISVEVYQKQSNI